MLFNISSFIPAISFILYVLFTIFGLHRRNGEKIHWPFILYMILMAVWSFGSFMMHANTILAKPLVWNRIMLIGMLGVPITIVHSVLDLFESKNRNYSYIIYVGYIIYMFLLYLNFRGYIVSQAWFEGDQFNYKLGRGASLAYILSYVFLIFCIGMLLRELYKTKNEYVKRKLRLPLFGASVMLLGVAVNLYEPIGRYPFDLFTSTINAFVIFYAIYKYRLVHYSAFVIRAILYFVLVIISALIFYGIFWISSKVMRNVPFEYSFLLSLFLGMVAAVVFQPLRTGTLSIIEKLYFGKRIDYYRSLRNFSESLTTVVELKLLGDSTVRKVVETFNLEWSFMMVLDYISRNYRLVACSGIELDASAVKNLVVHRNSLIVKALLKKNGGLHKPGFEESIVLESSEGLHELRPSYILPLKFKDKLNGFLCLGLRKNNEYYDQFDVETLEILAGQCSVALENAISFEKLKRQQKRVQNMNKELIISKNKLEAFFDGITTPISIQDINYNIITVNYASTRYFKKSFDKLIGRKCYHVFFGRNKPCENCMAQDSLHAQLPFSIERVDETTGMTFSIHFYPISVPAGSDRIFLEFFQDITQQKRLQKELIQSEKLAGIGTLASGIAHEINNPLYGIIGTAEIMLEETESNTAVKEYTKDIINYAQNAADIIKDLTNYSRKEKLEPVSVNIVDIIEVSLKLARRGMNFEKIKVKKYYDEIPSIEANANELQQVFLNLIINAVQAMNGEGILSLEARQGNGSALILVSDTGKGIEEKYVEDIFNPFFTTKDPGSGTGLGLSIVYQIMQNMGGRITVDSKVDRGTTFSVCLPLSKAETNRIYFIRVDNEREMEDVFFLQRKILIGEKGYLEETIRREKDEKAFLLLAYKGLHPVGTVSCITDRMAHELPIEEHFDLQKFKRGKRCVEIDRLAVLKEERGSIIPLGLMTLAYLFAKSENSERVFLDVFSDEKKYISMYKKLGFQEVGSYTWLLPVTVMMMDQRTDYEKKTQRMEQFVKPFITRLMKRIELDEEDRQRILKAVETIIKQSPPEYKETLESY